MSKCPKCNSPRQQGSISAPFVITAEQWDAAIQDIADGQNGLSIVFLAGYPRPMLHDKYTGWYWRCPERSNHANL